MRLDLWCFKNIPHIESFWEQNHWPSYPIVVDEKMTIWKTIKSQSRSIKRKYRILLFVEEFMSWRLMMIEFPLKISLVKLWVVPLTRILLLLSRTLFCWKTSWVVNQFRLLNKKTLLSSLKQTLFHFLLDSLAMYWKAGQ